MTPEQKRQIIEYYFEAPNTKAVLEDEDMDLTRCEIGEFLGEVFDLLVERYA